MSRKLHAALNRLIPNAVRSGLRSLARSTIPSMRHLDMGWRLRHLRSLGFSPAVVLDVGAATGAWAKLAHELWPDARVFGFEPNASNRDSLEATRAAIAASGRGSFDYRTCFLGPEKKSVEYVDRAHGTSIYLPAVQRESTTRSEMLRLDDLLAAGEVPTPSLIKLDVQGFELEVLRGGETALSRADAVLMEVSWYHVQPEMPTAMDVLTYMHDRDFFWYDVMGIYRRVSDDALAQMDFMFLRQTHPLVRDAFD